MLKLRGQADAVAEQTMRLEDKIAKHNAQLLTDQDERERLTREIASLRQRAEQAEQMAADAGKRGDDHAAEAQRFSEEARRARAALRQAGEQGKNKMKDLARRLAASSTERDEVRRSLLRVQAEGREREDELAQLRRQARELEEAAGVAEKKEADLMSELREAGNA